MKSQALNGRVRLSYGELAKLSGLTVKAVRLEIRRLAQSGYIGIEKMSISGTRSFRYEYILHAKPSVDGASIIKVLYCEIVSERTDKDCDPLYSFNGYSAIFAKVSQLCKTNQMNEAIYTLSVFHCFPENWCNKTFKQPYPPPYLFLNKKHAQDRYEVFKRFIYQHAEPEEMETMTEDERMAEETRVWTLMGKPREKETLKLLLDNGTISAKLFKLISKGSV